MKLLSGLVCLAGIVSAVVSSTCRLVSLSGGGSHGAFEAGVLSRIVEREDFQPWDVTVGVSAGSLGVLSLLKDDYEANMEYVRRMWWGTRTSDVLSPLSSDTALSGNEKVMHLIDDTYMHLKGSRSGGVFRVGVTDLETGKFVSLPLLSDPPDLTRVLASTSIPVVFPPVEIPHLGRLFVDGGLQTNEMIFSALPFCPSGTKDYEMDLIFAYFEGNDYHPSDWNLITIALRAVDLVTKEFNNLLFKTLGDCREGKSDGRITIRLHMPGRDSPSSRISTLDFDHGEELWKLGFYNSTVTVLRC